MNDVVKDELIVGVNKVSSDDSKIRGVSYGGRWFDRAKFVVPLLIAYLYASGRLYFDVYMEKIGFSGASLDGVLSPVTYSFASFSSFAMNFLSVDYRNYAIHILTPSLIGAFVIIVLVCSIRFRWKSKRVGRINSKGGVGVDNERENIFEWFVSKYWIALSLASFPFVWLLYFIVLIVFSMVLALALLPFAVPVISGVNDAEKYLAKNNGVVCSSFDWEDEEMLKRNLVLACERLYASENGKSVVLLGDTIHADSGFIYFVTNDALYRINNNKEVVTKSVKQRRTDADADADANTNTNTNT